MSIRLANTLSSPAPAALLLVLLVAVTGCRDEDTPPIDSGIDLTNIPYNPQPYQLLAPDYYPEMKVPADNPTTLDGARLGQHLFYDPILSADSTMACVNCHLPDKAWTDGLAVSTGIDGIAGKRSSMTLFNVGYYDTGLFWDGRSATLEEQALLPIEDPLELHDDWPNVMIKLKRHYLYPELFRRAFGITRIDEMTKEMAAKAMAQFQRTITASGDSKYDRWQRDDYFPSDLEFRGQQHFFDISDDFNQLECGHCHNAPLMTSNDYFNNGLQAAESIDDFNDLGRGPVVGNRIKNGFMRAPTLYNLSLSAPYMHDGSIATIDGVIEHYVSGGLPSPSKDVLIDDVSKDPVSELDKRALKAFIDMFVDTAYLSNPLLQNPWQG